MVQTVSAGERPFLLLVAVLAVGAPASARPGPADEAIAHLRSGLADPIGRQVTLVALQATRDPQLVPFFRALTRCDDARERLQAVRALGALAGDSDSPEDAITALRTVLQDDPVTAVRTEALSALLELDALSNGELQDLLAGGSEPLECLAARALVRRHRGGTSVDVLDKLTGSADRATACLARLTLLRMGYTDHADPLAGAMLDADTPVSLIAALLEEIAQDQIDPALPVVEAVLRSGSRSAQAYAYKALAVVAPEGPRRVREAIEASDQTVYRVRLFSVLPDVPDGRREIEALARPPTAAEGGLSRVEARGTDAVAELARFELARGQDPDALRVALSALLRRGHPVLAEYVLAAAREDLRADPDSAHPYTAPLLDYIGSVSTETERMGPEHRRAAEAARFLVRLGTPEALAGLEKALSGGYDAVARSVAAGLLRSVGADLSGTEGSSLDPAPAVRSLMLPLLSSPNPELRTDAALALGAVGDRAAEEQLIQAVRRPGRHPPALSALAAWYLLKIHDRRADAARDLAGATLESTSAGR